MPILFPLGSPSWFPSGNIRPPFLNILADIFWLLASPRPPPQLRQGLLRDEGCFQAMLHSGSWLSLSQVFLVHMPSTFPLRPFAYLGNILLLIIWFSNFSRLNKDSDPFCVLPFFRLQMMSLTSVMWAIIYPKTIPVLQTTFLGKVCILSAPSLFCLLSKLECWWFSKKPFSPSLIFPFAASWSSIHFICI